MSCTIMDGKAVAARIKQEVKEELSHLKFREPPRLAILTVGADNPSRVYVQNKLKDCEECGFAHNWKLLPPAAAVGDIKHAIHNWNASRVTAGIIVQLPMAGVDRHMYQPILDEVNVMKDVDGLTDHNVLGLWTGTHISHYPCTPAGVIALLDEYHVPIKGANVVILGRSGIVGKPLAAMMLRRNANVTILHSHTDIGDRIDYVHNADIVVSAVGKPNIIGNEVKAGAAVIDVGIHRGEDGKLHGDVDFDQVVKKAAFITPVPGGVGPMTRAMLMKNLLQAAKIVITR